VTHRARLEDTGSGLAPVEDGWFVVSVRDAAWLQNDAFGHRCVFEADVPVLRQRPDLEPHRFTQVGVTLTVLEPGTPSGLYHAETDQEAFLVLAGACDLVVEGEERRLRAWDFFHCPAGTAHVFVGTGDAPCVLLMLGARSDGHRTTYPVEPAARHRGAGVDTETDSPRAAYAGRPHWQPGRIEAARGLPWQQA
jgi:uncharacterized cupin superfamily protein